MALTLLDRITDLQPGVSIGAIKRLRPEEEYLQDHFPRFPVMPGVLMLETLFQAASWLLHATEDFRNTVVMLREARNVKYADFVQPGQTLRIEVELVELGEREAIFKARGLVGEVTAVTARLTLERYRTAERYPDRAGWEAESRRKLRERFARLYQPETGVVQT
jgi:3-hydroxyacyl-[acyl-carrier-protein] dehydratase